MDPYIGKFLDDRYEILDVLGTGGMAVVYRAYCHRLNRYVAVKILKSELASDKDLRRRFHDESQAVAMLSHPNIVAVYDVNQVDDSEYIVMELIDGITLKQYMRKRGGCLNWREALHFSTQILQGLKHAHSRGIIHRDIKPQNVMVLRDGSVKVTDFGIARSTTSQATMTQEAIGSVHYISPEQARGSHIDARSDLYSAGVVLYEMLTGRLPYEGDNPVSVAIQHINSIPIAPRELNSGVPVGIEQITLKAMASVADRRYANAEQMLQDLDDFRRNPEINFGYVAPGLVIPEEEEPTMVRKGTGGFVGASGAELTDMDATVREPVVSGRRAAARFERDQTPEPTDDYDDYDEVAERRKNRLFIGLAAGAAGLLLIIFIILWFTLFRGLFAEKPTYNVPNFIGSTLQEAQDALALDEALGTHFTIVVDEYQASDEYEAGLIIDQTPTGGRTTTQEMTEIQVIISSGPAEEDPQEIILKDYEGQDYRAVKMELEELLLRVTLEGEYSETVEKGMVIRTDPVDGTPLLPGDLVTVYYSQGEETKTVEMTSLLGLTEEDARNAIAAMKLTLTNVSTEYSDVYDEGKVCYQSIPDRTVVDEGTSISIKISLGPEPVDDPTVDDPEITDPPVTDNPVTSIKTIIVNLPADRTADCEVVITVNGNILTKTTASVDETDVAAEFEGDILTCIVTVDGSDYTDYEIINDIT